MFMPFLRAPGTVSDLKNNLESLYTTTKGRDRKVTLREGRAQINKSKQTWRRTVCPLGAVIDLLDYAQELIHPSNNDNMKLCGNLLRLLTNASEVRANDRDMDSRPSGAIFLWSLSTTALLVLCKHRPDKLCCMAVSAAYALVKPLFMCGRGPSSTSRLKAAVTDYAATALLVLCKHRPDKLCCMAVSAAYALVKILGENRRDEKEEEVEEDSVEDGSRILEDSQDMRFNDEFGGLDEEEKSLNSDLKNLF
ncbi:hypothetical protein AAMO2058_000566300 [Amorphochlora amoebiformis]